MNAVIYARYSSHNQREESIEGQIRECMAFAEKNEITIVDEYIDRAISGKTDNRPAFQKLIRDSAKHRFDAVIMYTMDRFARNRYDSAIYKAKLKQNAVRLYYAKQPMPDGPEAIILESVMEGYAEYYSENLSRSIKRGMTENALQGISTGGHTPLGYKLNSERRYEIEPVGAEAVRLIYQMYAEGHRISEILNQLNTLGYKTARGKAFTSNSLSTILKNSNYKGEYHYDGTVIENAVPVIIEPELFDKVQARRTLNGVTKGRSKAKEEYLLTTKLFCGHCGTPMIGDSGTSRHGTVHRYYTCRARKRQNACNKQSVRKEAIEQLVVATTVEQVLTDQVIDKIATHVMTILQKEFEDNSVLLRLQEQLKDTEKRSKNVMSAIEQGIIMDSTKDRLRELEASRKELERQIAREESKKPFLTKEHIMFWLNSFRNGDLKKVEYQRKIIDTLVNSVYLFDEDDGGKRIVIAFNVSGLPSKTLTRSDIDCYAPPNQ